MTNRFAQELLKIRHTHESILPSKQKVQQFADDLIELLFPHFCGDYEYFAPEEIEGKLALLERDLKKILKSQQPEKAKAVDKITAKFFSKVIVNDYRGSPVVIWFFVLVTVSTLSIVLSITS